MTDSPDHAKPDGAKPDDAKADAGPARPVPAVPMMSGPAASEATAAGLFDRALDNLRARWREIAASALGAVGAASPFPSSSLARGGADRLREQVEDCLRARGGEVSARARAAQLGRVYLGLDAEGRRGFLTMLARDFDVDRAAVDEAIAAFQAAAEPAARGRAERALRRALEPPRVRLLTQFNGLPEGVKFLVDLRAELIGMAGAADAGAEPPLRALEDDLKNLLRTWFDVGFLEMRQITWESPAALLEKLIAYEAVHEINGWQDLKDRLDSDRRCFAFFHPRMPDEPLIFVEVALVGAMSGNVQALLDPSAPVGDPRTAKCAIFYSISNAQRGLAGISFGNFLIKRVADRLAAEFPNITDFATLSPIPGFRRWLDREMGRRGAALLTDAEAGRLAAAAGGAAGEEGAGRPDGQGLLEAALAVPGWHADGGLEAALRPALTRLCARYLTATRGAEPNGAGGPARALDPVAHFHLSNGARMERLNWMADRSAKGLRQSCGMMINYRYKLADIEANHEAYSGEGRIIASSAVRSLAKRGV